MYKLSKTIDSYNKQVEWHSAKFDGYDFKEYIQQFVGLLKGNRVLDFGCGNRRDLSVLSGYKLELTGIDFSDEMLKIARKRIKNAKILKMDFMKKLKFHDEEFDGIWACASLLHIPKRSLNKILNELKRILKNDGVLFISAKEGSGERIVKDDFGKEKRFFSFFKRKELTNILKGHNFFVERPILVPDSKLMIAFSKKKAKQNWLLLFCRKNAIQNPSF